MAEIGTQIPEEQDLPLNKGVGIGEAILNQGVQVPDDEVSRSPQFAKNLEWLKKPENLMTALVFLGAAMQPKRDGLNTAQHVARAGVGALGFNSAYRASQRDEERTMQEENRKNQIATEEAQFRRDQIGLGKEQVAATRENTAADKQVGMEQIAAQRWLAEQGNEMRMQIARMEADTAMRIAQMEASLKSAGMNAMFGPDDMKVINDRVALSQDGPNPITHQQATIEYMRNKFASNPAYWPLLEIWERAAAGEAPAPTAPKPAGGSRRADMTGLGPVSVTAGRKEPTRNFGKAGEWPASTVKPVPRETLAERRRREERERNGN